MTTAMAVQKTRPLCKTLTFDALVEQIRRTLAQGKARAVEAVDRERARTYWETGRFIHIYLLKGEDRAKYGAKLIPKLARTIGVSPRLAQDWVAVYRAFPILQAPAKLTWTDLVLLAEVENPKTRLALAKETALKDWTTREVEAAVRKVQRSSSLSMSPRHDFRPGSPTKPFGDDGKQKHSGMTAKLIPKKGRFFVYQIVRPQNLHPAEKEYSLDLGFRNRVSLELPGVANPREGDFIQALRIRKSASGDKYEFKKTQGKKGVHTYKAKAQKYYDADTFWVDVDLGFRVWTEQKLRLRGIDSKELGAGGEKAARYVQKVLSAVPFMVITVAGRDKFGRPLADVFYLPGADDREKVLAEGRFLNQELLDLGLAVLAKD